MNNIKQWEKDYILYFFFNEAKRLYSNDDIIEYCNNKQDEIKERRFNLCYEKYIKGTLQ